MTVQMYNQTSYDFDWKTLRVIALSTLDTKQCINVFNDTEGLADSRNFLPAQFVSDVKALGQISTSVSNGNCSLNSNSEQYWLVTPVGSRNNSFW